jgi:tRNA (cmo5U34)-methyltransferase
MAVQSDLSMKMEMPDDSTVSCYDDHARAYDAYQSAVVPCYDEMIDLVAKTCQRYLGKSPMILDLGCGTGNASIAVQKRIPARIFLIDGSSSMVNIAREKIDLESPGLVVGHRVADISKAGWDEGLGTEKYDAIVSTLVLEHLPFDSYRRVLNSCYRLLKPGGWLIAAEGYEEDGNDMLQWFNEEMEFLRSRLDPKMSDFVAQLRSEKEVHYYCSKVQKADWWRAAGFQQVNVLWQYLCIALMVGRKLH